MTMTKDLGLLLITIDNAVVTVFQDDAFITHVVPSPSYHDDGTLLDITVSIRADKFAKDNLEQRLEIFDNLIYNPVFHSDHILSKVNIAIKEI